jgi:Predicted membrane protein (DUF2157)
MGAQAPPPNDPRTTDLNGRLEAWSEERLITPEQADAIRVYEASRGAHPLRETGRTTPVTEALAYLGVALAVAALTVIVGRSWADLSTGAHIAIPGLIALALFVVGWATRDGSDPAVGRVSHVAWFFSAAAIAWFAIELAVGGFDETDRWPLLWAGLATAVYAGALYLLRPAALQHVALLIGLVMLAGAVLFDSGVAAWSAIWALGALWIVLGWKGVLVGRATACTIGTIVALVSVGLVVVNAGPGWSWLAVVNAAVLIGAAVVLRQTPMLVLAAIGLFAGTVTTIDHYIGGGTGTAVGLLVAGILVLAVAVLVARRRRPESTG